MNYPDGFNCPNCAWPDPDREKTLKMWAATTPWDKLGGRIADGMDFGRRFCVIVSRCSYERMHKAIMAGMPELVAVTAPTARALRVAGGMRGCT